MEAGWEDCSSPQRRAVLVERCGVSVINTAYSEIRRLCSVTRCSHFSGSPSGKLVFIDVERDFDEVLYLYAKPCRICTVELHFFVFLSLANKTLVY